MKTKKKGIDWLNDPKWLVSHDIVAGVVMDYERWHYIAQGQPTAATSLTVTFIPDSNIICPEKIPTFADFKKNRRGGNLLQSLRVPTLRPTCQSSRTS